LGLVVVGENNVLQIECKLSDRPAADHPSRSNHHADNQIFSPSGLGAQELLRFYTRTPERPRGFAFDEPFLLPAGLRAVSTERGAVTVTQ
jgi:hypothetical protein